MSKNSPHSAQYSLISLGCARTLVDSEKMVDSLGQHGFQLVSENSKEPITILNTCSFIQAAIEETEANILALVDKKKSNQIKYLAVVGCYPSRFKKSDLEKKYPEVDIWLGTQEEHLLQTQLSELVFNQKYNPKTPKGYIKLTPSHFAYIKISEGCDNWCSFCTIPKIRGTHKSKTIDEILREAELQIKFGAKELLLIGEDTTCWGEDLFGKPAFPKLLRELAHLPVKWIRPMYIFPARVDDAFIKVLADFPHLYNYVDMPIQHCSDDILSGMRRGHDSAHLHRILKEMKQANPALSLRTTVMVGFPGETEAQFNELQEFIQTYSFSHLGSFGYSEEKETKSARLTDKCDPKLIQDRVHKLMDTQFEVAQRNQKKRIGQTYSVIYEGNGTARSYWEAPDVDSKLIVTQSQGLDIGQEITVTAIAPQGYDLVVERKK